LSISHFAHYLSKVRAAISRSDSQSPGFLASALVRVLGLLRSPQNTSFAQTLGSHSQNSIFLYFERLISMRICILIIFFGFTTSSEACTCMSFPERIDSGDVNNQNLELFTGKIVSRKKKRFGSSRPFYVYTLAVNQKFTLKSSERKIKIISPTTSGECGYLFKVGEEYLISTSGINQKTGMRHTSICQRNALTKNASSEIELIQSMVENGS